MMEVSPKTLREVEFREKMRGYHPEDVDQFLEQVAAGIEVMQERLRQAVERAQRAEAAAAEAGGNDETLRRTLVLAQRTADLAVQEAREQAARILAGAEQQAQAMLGEAEESARRIQEDALAESRAELAKLESVRAQAEQEAEALNRWVEEHRGHLSTALKDALGVIERAGLLSPPPATTPVVLPPRRAKPSASPTLSQDLQGGGTDTISWQPTEEEVAELRGEDRRSEGDRAFAGVHAPMAAEAASGRARAQRGPDEQALDDFFDGDDGDDRRFGGRLRKRR